MLQVCFTPECAVAQEGFLLWDLLESHSWIQWRYNLSQEQNAAAPVPRSFSDHGDNSVATVVVYCKWTELPKGAEDHISTTEGHRDSWFDGM